MSCGTGCNTCGSQDPCGSGDCGPSDEPIMITANKSQILQQALGSLPVEILVQEALTIWKNDVTMDEKQADAWELYMNHIGMELAQNVAANVKPLVGVFETKGPHRFLMLCKRLIEIGLTGHKIAWAFEYTDGDLNEFYESILTSDEDMLVHVNTRVLYHSTVTKEPMDLVVINAAPLRKRPTTHKTTSPQTSPSTTNQTPSSQRPLDPVAPKPSKLVEAPSIQKSNNASSFLVQILSVFGLLLLVSFVYEAKGASLLASFR